MIAKMNIAIHLLADMKFSPSHLQHPRLVAVENSRFYLHLQDATDEPRYAISAIPNVTIVDRMGRKPQLKAVAHAQPRSGPFFCPLRSLAGFEP